LHHDGASAFEQAVLCATLSPDARTALTGGRDGSARLWDPRTGKQLLPPLVHQGPVNAVAFSIDGRTLATGSDDRSARVWDAATGQPIGTPLMQRGPVRAIAFSPDARRLLVGCAYLQDRIWRGQGRIWEIASHAPVGDALRCAGRINAVAYAPDGNAVVTAGDDRIAQFWESATGRPLGPPLVHGNIVISAAYSTDGAELFTDCPIGDPAAAPASEPAAVNTFTWRVPRPLSGTPAQIQTWVQVLTRLEFDKSNLIHPLDDTIWLARRRALESAHLPLPQ